MHDLEAFTDTDELKAKFEKRLVWSRLINIFFQ